MLSDINQSKIPYGPPPRVTEIETKVNKWYPITLKSFCTANKTINKKKRQPRQWEKILANEGNNKRLIFKMYKQLMQFYIKNQTVQSKMSSRSK